MNNKNINPIIIELFKTIETTKGIESSDAINALCMLLEKRNLNLSLEESHTRYNTYIPKKVIELCIDAKEELEIIKFFQKQIASDCEHIDGILFAMGKASHRVALKPLVETTKQYLEKFNENQVYQLIVSLERLVFFNDIDDFEDVKIILNQTKLLNCISKKFLSLQPISHRGLDSTYGRFLARTSLLLNEEKNDAIEI